MESLPRLPGQLAGRAVKLHALELVVRYQKHFKKMNETPFLSIIIPVYNVEKYLNQCVDSILNQSVIDYEIILVNDGSTDSSGELCDSYAKKNKEIVVVNKINGGLSSARNGELRHLLLLKSLGQARTLRTRPFRKTHCGNSATVLDLCEQTP